MQLKRPLVVFDLETTGLDVAQSRIIEIGYIKLMPNGEQETGNLRINPGVPIPAESTAVHGITDTDVADAPSFSELSEQLVEVFSSVDLAGFNSDHFDVPLLVEECLRHNVPIDFSEARCIDVQNIFHKMEPRTLAAALLFYCNTPLEHAHSASADASATLKVLEAQLSRYQDTLANDVEGIVAFSRRNNNVDFSGRMVYNERNEEVFNFGKYRGQRVEDVLEKDPGYFGWIMQGNFTLHTKQMLTKIRLRTLKNL